jgi:peptidoglycan/LPS O-acetylase OafA/YrhL
LPAQPEQHIAGLTGLRGVAALLVIGFHYFLVDFGWVGVQIFFVLSSYLITGILLRQTEAAPRVFFGNFYGRRLLRIFPLYYAFLLIVGLLVLSPLDTSNLGAAWPYAMTHTYNIAVGVEESQRNFFFTHLWSLNVEEQFYLLWPLLIYFTPRALLPRVLVGFLLLGPILRWGIYLWSESAWPGARGVVSVYVMPLSYLDAFAAGSLVALGGVVIRTRWFLASVCLLLVTGAINAGGLGSDLGFPINMADGWQFIWGYSVLNLVAATLIGAIASSEKPYPMLSWPLLIYLGRISYGLYLLHRPMVAVALALVSGLGLDIAPSDGLFVLLCLALTLVVSALSFHFFEEPISRLKYRWFAYPETRTGRG